MSEQPPLYERDDAAQPAPDSQPEKKQPRNKWTAFFVAIGILSVIFFVAFFGYDGTSGVASQRNANNVEVIDIAGTIEEAGDTYNQSFVEQRISVAKNDPNNVAIMLLVDSPGGTVYECDETYLALLDYKEETGRPIYTYCESMCASAAYYISMASDEVIANRNSLVGSIGVITGQFVDATELLEKLGIDITTVHSGANKLMGQPYEKPTEEQIAIYQALSDETYDRFVGIVAESRGMTEDAVRALADGRVYSAQQGVENGLIDGIMTQDEFDDHLRDLLGDDISFYHKTYELKTSSLIWEFLNNAVSALRANGDEVNASLQAIDEMTYDEPMLIYEP